MIIETDKTIDMLLNLARGDIDIVRSAIFECAKGKESAKLSDVIDYITKIFDTDSIINQ